MRHAVNEEVVADLRVGVDALGVGLGHALGENPRVLRVEEQVDPGQLTVLVLAVPVAGVDFALSIVRMDKDVFPLGGAVLVTVETLAGNGSEIAVLVVAEGDPLLGQAAVILRVVEGLQGQPVGWVVGRVLVIDALYYKKWGQLRDSNEKNKTYQLV
jgi:hypothetical protein